MKGHGGHLGRVDAPPTDLAQSSACIGTVEERGNNNNIYVMKDREDIKEVHTWRSESTGGGCLLGEQGKT